MCKLITKLISKIFGGPNIKATNRSSHNSIKGDAYNSPQAGKNAIISYGNNFIVNNEKEPNNTLMNSDYIKSPNEPIYGYFIKSYSNITIDDTLKPYIKPQNIVDIDCYKVENSTDISTSINIILSDADNADMILFDENFNYLKHGNNNNVSSDFQPKKVYYIVLICYGDKSITKRYSIHYKFN